MPIAFIDHSSGSAVTYYVHVDQVMNPQKLTDAAGAIVWDRVAEPFGVEISATGALTQPLRFPGQRHDSETGFSQNWHRDYDPFLGRYIQSDPIGLMGGVNTYEYVAGNPLGNWDREGLQQGGASPPPSVPGGPDWRWSPDPNNSRGGRFLGSDRHSASWDRPGSHWDVDDGRGNRTRYDRWGNRLDDNDPHRYERECKPRVPPILRFPLAPICPICPYYPVTQYPIGNYVPKPPEI